jgi:hypothetical protein
LLFPKRSKKVVKQPVLFGDTEEEVGILQALTDGERDGEKIMGRLGLTPSLFNQTITLMEIKGLVRSLGANRWAMR